MNASVLHQTIANCHNQFSFGATKKTAPEEKGTDGKPFLIVEDRKKNARQSAADKSTIINDVGTFFTTQIPIKEATLQEGQNKTVRGCRTNGEFII